MTSLNGSRGAISLVLISGRFQTNWLPGHNCLLLPTGPAGWWFFQDAASFALLSFRSASNYSGLSSRSFRQRGRNRGLCRSVRLKVSVIARNSIYWGVWQTHNFNVFAYKLGNQGGIYFFWNCLFGSKSLGIWWVGCAKTSKIKMMTLKIPFVL